MGPAKFAPEVSATVSSPAEAVTRARFVRTQLPPNGLFAGQTWRISPDPFPLERKLVAELEQLGRVLLQFYRAVNLLYRQSAAGKQPDWVARLLDQGKPGPLLDLQRSPAFRNDVPRVIRPDLLLTEDGFRITELDSVPGGIGLTAWLNETYCAAQNGNSSVIGGARGMIDGFASMFESQPRVHMIVSEEAATYRPEMDWLSERLGHDRFRVSDARTASVEDGDAVYRFWELFDLPNVPLAAELFTRAADKRITLTPPPKSIFEEKLLFALLWNRNLHAFWRQNLGEGFFTRLRRVVPYSWVLDPTPLPPHAAYPELNLTDWQQLKMLSQRERDLILKVSGFSPEAWGARGVYLGSDLSHEDWSVAVDKALAAFPQSPYVLQRYEHPRVIESRYFDFSGEELKTLRGRVRLCPYYFVSGEGDRAVAKLGGVLATICPADKKIIHGMADAILAPCSSGNESS